VHGEFELDRLKERFAKAALNVGKNDQLIKELLRQDLIALRGETGLSIAPITVKPVALARRLLGGYRQDADLIFYVMRSIRQHYGTILSPRTMHLFMLLSDRINREIEGTSDQDKWYKISRHAIDDCRNAVLQDQQDSRLEYCGDAVEREAQEFVECFMEVCRAVEFLGVAKEASSLWFRTPRVDGEYLVSHLFGMPTGIPGLDQLFGGAGIVLPDGAGSKSAHALALDSGRLLGKAIVVTGQRGTGKSILASQLAATVAKRGGIAWLMAFDQSAEECQYTLESLGALGEPRYLRLANDVPSAGQAATDATEDMGALILLSPVDPKLHPNTAFKEFVEQVAFTASGVSEHKGLRLLVIDSLNSRLLGSRDLTACELRNETLRMIQTVKETGTNILFVVEDATGISGTDDTVQLETPQCLPFAEYVADIIIRLSTQRKYHYCQRYIEVTKSRMQREQRGEHAFSIRCGEGIRVYPSAASVHARILPRRTDPIEGGCKFGVRDIDSMLGDSGLYTSDIISLRGPSGSFKSAFGLCFLLSQESGTAGLRDRSTSLLFTVGESIAGSRHFLRYRYYPTRSKNRAPVRLQDLARDGDCSGRHSNKLRIIGLPSGHITAGAVLQRIEREIERVRATGNRVHRVMISNIGEWESSSPFIREDRTFATTLIELLRSENISCVLICHEGHREAEETLVDRVIENSDCVFQFDRFEFRGLRRVAFRISRTRDMQHRLESFEVLNKGGLLELAPSCSLLRLHGSQGEVSPVPIRLFLHAESTMQSQYNRSVKSAISAVLSQRTELDSQERLYVRTLMGVGEMSAVDELQLLQLDEYQLGLRGSGESSGYFSLYEFPGSLWDNEQWSHMCLGSAREGIAVIESGKVTPSEQETVPTRRVKSFHAVPYLVNIGLLAYRQDCFPSGFPNDWEQISRCSWLWRQERLAARNPDIGNHASRSERCENWKNADLFFDFTKGTNENYVCMFLEILLSLGIEPNVTTGECCIRQWLNTPAAKKAAGIFWELSHEAHMRDGGTAAIAKMSEIQEDEYKARNFSVSRKAIVWRHWYTTLNQMLHEMFCAKGEALECSPIEVTMLPKDRMIAGEWYLGIPAYSAAPEVGLQLMKFMTSRDAELNRVRLGVGLPTRADFYSGWRHGGQKRVPVSPYFDLDTERIEKLLPLAFRRSDLGCYPQIASALGEQLRQLAAISPPKEAANWDIEQEYIAAHAEHALAMLRRNLDFLQGVAEPCGKTSFGDLTPQCKKCRTRFRSKGPL
jgi:KaiC/GvpD/RAD55 family RecA-like ATPase